MIFFFFFVGRSFISFLLFFIVLFLVFTFFPSRISFCVCFSIYIYLSFFSFFFFSVFICLTAFLFLSYFFLLLSFFLSFFHLIIRILLFFTSTTFIFLLKRPHVQIAFLKFTSCDNQDLVGSIPIARCSCSFEREIIKIGQSSHKIYSDNTLNIQESTTILNACTKKSGNLLKPPRI